MTAPCRLRDGEQRNPRALDRFRCSNCGHEGVGQLLDAPVKLVCSGCGAN